MAKKAKKVQTDYTKGGRDISNTAVPLYQTNLQRIDEYNANPNAMTDANLEKYYTNTTAQNGENKTNSEIKEATKKIGKKIEC